MNYLIILFKTGQVNIIIAETSYLRERKTLQTLVTSINTVVELRVVPLKIQQSSTERKGKRLLGET